MPTEERFDPTKAESGVVVAGIQFGRSEPIKIGLLNRGIILHYMVDGQETAVSLGPEGMKRTPFERIGMSPYREIVLKVDLDTSHLLLTQQLTFGQAKSRKLLEFQGDPIRLSWLLPHLDVAFRAYKAEFDTPVAGSPGS